MHNGQGVKKQRHGDLPPSGDFRHVIVLHGGCPIVCEAAFHEVFTADRDRQITNIG